MIEISKNRLDELQNGFEGKRIAVIGDMMLDGYYWGDVKRISPEAPVPVLEVEEELAHLHEASLHVLVRDMATCDLLDLVFDLPQLATGVLNLAGTDLRPGVRLPIQASIHIDGRYPVHLMQ